MKKIMEFLGMTNEVPKELPSRAVAIKGADLARFMPWFQTFAESIREMKPNVTEFEEGPDGKTVQALFEQGVLPAKAAFQYLEQRGLLSQPSKTVN